MAAMDLVWYRRYRADGGDKGVVAWEFSTSASGFDDEAPAPAQVGKLVADAVGITLPDSAVATTNNVVHWMTGIGWGKVGGLVAAAGPDPETRCWYRHRAHGLGHVVRRARQAGHLPTDE